MGDVVMGSYQTGRGPTVEAARLAATMTIDVSGPSARIATHRRYTDQDKRACDAVGLGYKKYNKQQVTSSPRLGGPGHWPLMLIACIDVVALRFTG